METSRFWPMLLLGMCRYTVFYLLAASLCAEERIVSTRIFTEPSGAEFVVDGQVYRGSATFLWPERSKHVLSIPAADQAPNSDLYRYSFQEWQNSAGVIMVEGATIAITADAGTPYYKGVWRLFYSVALKLPDVGLPFDCTGGPEWGKVYLSIPGAGSCYSQSVVLWGEAGLTVNVQVHPPAGWVFVGWTGWMGGADGPNFSFTLNGPVSMFARFAVATRVSLATSPPGFKLYADRTVVSTPIVFDWAQDSQHFVGPVEPQRDETGGVWVFESWSDGGAANHAYAVGSVSIPVNLVAKFTIGYTVTVGSEPPGLKLTVDGTPTSDRRFNWGVGSTHSISAPAEAVDAKGRHYVFRSWSNGGAAAQELTVTVADQAWIANYDALNSLTVRAIPAGAAFTVDGAPCPASCTVYRPAGAEVSVSAPASVASGDGARLEFQVWSDGGAATHTVKLAQPEQTVTASYQPAYRLTAATDPPAGADFRFDPASPDGFYAAGTSVVVIAQPRLGFQFRWWNGDLAGSLPSGVVKMNGSRSVCAVLDRVAYVAPAGVRNAAGDTPEAGVAAGSIVSIYGGGLASGTAVGPPSPLVQTLGQVTVRVADRLLPLFYVSPEQINALLLSDLAEGEYTLAVRWEGHPEVRATFRVVRNAPGLFTRPVGNVPYALASHADGALVTVEAPARRGETVTLLGTGFGPYRGQALDGYAIPDSVVLPVADPVKILAGGQQLDPVFAGAASGLVGLVAIRFRVPEAAAAPSLELRAWVNGKESNTVALPIRASVP